MMVWPLLHYLDKQAPLKFCSHAQRLANSVLFLIIVISWLYSVLSMVQFFYTRPPTGRDGRGKKLGHFTLGPNLLGSQNLGKPALPLDRDIIVYPRNIN